MATLLGYLPTSPSSAWAVRLVERLTNEESDRLSALTNHALSLLAPLAQSTSKENLDILLTHTAPRYLRLLGELGQWLWPALTEAEYAEEIIADLYADIRSAAEVKKDLFGEKAFEQYMASLDSSEAFLFWTIRAGKKLQEYSDRDLLDWMKLSTQPVLSSALHANMCMSAIHLIVVDIIDEWQADSIPVLVSAADDFMTLVEDEFLTLELPTGTDAETVEYEAVRRELGL